MGRNRAGAKGADVVLKVPVGTQILDEDNETLIADLTEVGQRVLLAKGGNGGFGNAHFKTSTNQAPRRANPGLEGEERWIWLRLKLIADAGLVGLPNAGKSTFLAAVIGGEAEDRRLSVHDAASRPRRRRASTGANSCSPTFPGLIEGAHEGAGLGDRFLGHVERCRVLLHLVDGTSEHAGEAYKHRARASSRPMATGSRTSPRSSRCPKPTPSTPNPERAGRPPQARREARAAGAVVGLGPGRAGGAARRDAGDRGRAHRGRSAASGRGVVPLRVVHASPSRYASRLA